MKRPLPNPLQRRGRCYARSIFNCWLALISVLSSMIGYAIGVVPIIFGKGNLPGELFVDSYSCLEVVDVHIFCEGETTVGNGVAVPTEYGDKMRAIEHGCGINKVAAGDLILLIEVYFALRIAGTIAAGRGLGVA